MLPTESYEYLDERARYFPEELIGAHNNESSTWMVYFCYLIELDQKFHYDVKPQNIVLAVHKMLHQDLGDFDFDLNADRGKLIVHVKLVGRFTLTPDEVALCQQFQVKLFNLLLKCNLDKLHEDDQHSSRDGSAIFNYLLIPALGSLHSLSIDWRCINSVLYCKNASLINHEKCSSSGVTGVHTKNGLVCHLQNVKHVMHISELSGNASL